MAKYVDYQKVWNMLNGIGGCGAKPDTWEDGWDKAIDTAISELNSIPAADVQEVRHGEWEKYSCLLGTYSKCSVCKRKSIIFSDVDISESLKLRSCPFCGARMDGENNDKHPT